MTSRTETPLAFKILGYGGLIPFFAGMVAVLTPGVGGAVFAFTIYTVAILSFLGGIQWGLVLMNPACGHTVERLCVGVLAPLIAAGALFIGPVPGLALLLVGFLGLLAWEGWRRTQLLPGWYLPLRLRLTAGVALCLAVVLIHLV